VDVPPRLLQQDQADFERVLAQALATERIRTALALSGRRSGAEQLRARAREAAPEIMAAAGAEYGEYARLRAAAELAVTLGRPTTDTRDAPADRGLIGALSVIGPILAGSSAVILLLLGHLLRFVPSQHQLADSVVEAAWTAAIIAAAGAFAGVIGLLVAATRHRSAGPGSARPAAAQDHLLRARDTWRTALLERGMLPFLTTDLGLDGRTA
jgi:hypothetical protein